MSELTPRERACFGPRQMRVPGSVEWCYQTLEVFKAIRARKEATDRRYREVLDEMEKHRVWEMVPHDRPYGTVEEMFRVECDG
jgi:hypothetical protein